MAKYLARRLLHAAITVVGVSLVIFLLLRVIPGDPAGLLFTPGSAITPDVLHAIRHDIGLDKPLWQQYFVYVGRALHGDLGRSYQTNSSVQHQILQTAPATLELTSGAIIVTVLVGVTAGVVSAVKHYSLLDYGTVLVASLGMSAPVFLTGLLLIFFFSVTFHWLPAAGRFNARDPGGLPDALRHLILPSLALGLNGAALLARITRSCMLDVITKTYVTTARAKGVGEGAVLLRHAFRNALVPVVTAIGLQVGYLLGGAVLTEAVFNWPGLGTLLVTGIFTRDYPVVQGVVLFISITFVLVNLLVDLFYVWLDPRIRYG